MADQLSLCNRALMAVGNEPLASLAQNDKPGRLVRALWPQLRDELLASHPWNFAITRTSLAALEAAPAWDYARAFGLPADCLRVWRLNLCHPLVRWRVEGRTIVTDEDAPLEVLYIRATEEVGYYPAGFASALVARLAMELAQPIAASASLRDQMTREYRAALSHARSQNAQEGAPERIWSDVLVDALHAGNSEPMVPFAASDLTP